MVFVAEDGAYPENSEYETYFQLFKYDLSPFQKHAIQAIVDGNHCLVTAPTGSGKTLPAEFAIRYFVERGKKVIYCSPIKALSNQKMFDFTQKYLDITFGLITGDIKTNPSADVLIMTTEILMNKLFMDSKTVTASTLTFEMDIESELGCVVFDELHYINDAHRGHVWEQSILMLPLHVQMVMLSATLDNPQKFARWIESRDNQERSDGHALSEVFDDSLEQKKQVVICPTSKRVVPLTHYIYISSPEGLFKKMKDKDTEQMVRKSLNRCLTIKSADGIFNQETYNETSKILRLMHKHDVHQKRSTVLNDLLLHLRDHDMLPAICFVFSRKLVEQCAEEVSVRVLEDDSKVPYTVHKECEAIIRRLPNWREYAGLPEYLTLVKLLEKGIGIHHSGMMPVLREIVEFMISKKHIRILFATESFAIGLDCPIKTAIFINLKKHDGGEHPRYLLPHEYTQMAGRAGRRGIDTVGHVIHCGNLFEQPDTNTYKEILCGKPQTLISKFHIYYSVVLNIFKTKTTVAIEDIEAFVSKSMYKSELESVERGLLQTQNEIENSLVDKINGFVNLKTQRLELETYDDLLNKSQFCTNKKLKEINAAIKAMKETHVDLAKDHMYYVEYTRLVKAVKETADRVEATRNCIQNEIANLLAVMLEYKIIYKIEVACTENCGGGGGCPCYGNVLYALTPERGVIAANIAEVNPALIAVLSTEWNYFADFSPAELAAFLSIFSDARVEEESEQSDMLAEFDRIRWELLQCQESHGVYMQETGLTDFSYGLMNVIKRWCYCDNEAECKMLIQEYELSIGDFTKAILKISTLARELMAACEKIGKIELMSKLAAIDGMILKYVATNQSLYL